MLRTHHGTYLFQIEVSRAKLSACVSSIRIPAERVSTAAVATISTAQAIQR